MDPGQPLSLRLKGLVEDIGEMMDKMTILSRDSIFILIQITEWIQDSL